MPTKYTSNQKLIVSEALRQTELHIEDLQALATVAETRAFHFSSSCVLIATLGVALAQVALSPFAVYVSAVGLIAAAFWALRSALPRKFHIRGHRWVHWKGHVDDDDLLQDVLISQAEENDTRIKYNFEKLEDSALHFRISLWIAFGSVAVFILGQLFVITRAGTVPL
jgi:hypothetical protein